MQYERLVDAKAIIGEGPVWDERNNCLYWVDIMGCLIHRYDPDTGRDDQCKLDKMVGAVALRQDGTLIAALTDGLATVDFSSGTVTELWMAVDESGNRFNDGKCDPDGRFWAGTMSLTGQQGTGSLYCMDRDLTVHKVLSDISISNGLAWSPDKKYVYYIDSPAKEVWRFDYSPVTVSLNNRQTVVRIAPDEGLPDGMTIDRQGRLWVAQWGGSRVCCYDPENGGKVSEVLFPVEQVSSCAFGGPDLGDLYVTTARNTLSEESLQRQPEAGALYRVRTDTSGFISDRFGG
ncbi:MAG: SMP-30/gluconolactonase/LRE family protein [Bacillota bacterium]|nr:SMP-30/gluconolactonase/LRE family protein [Bacillota bacterium]